MVREKGFVILIFNRLSAVLDQRWAAVERIQKVKVTGDGRVQVNGE